VPTRKYFKYSAIFVALKNFSTPWLIVTLGVILTEKSTFLVGLENHAQPKEIETIKPKTVPVPSGVIG